MGQAEFLDDEEGAQDFELSEETRTKLVEVQRVLQKEAGDLVLFGLFRLTETSFGWDLIVAADWVDPRLPDATAYVASKLERYLSVDERLLLSGIVTLQPTNPFVMRAFSAVTFRGNLLHFRNNRIGDLHIFDAWIYTSDRRVSNAFRPPAYVVQQEQPVRAKAPRAKPKKAAKGAGDVEQPPATPT